MSIGGSRDLTVGDSLFFYGESFDSMLVSARGSMTRDARELLPAVGRRKPVCSAAYTHQRSSWGNVSTRRNAAAIQNQELLCSSERVFPKLICMICEMHSLKGF